MSTPPSTPTLKSKTHNFLESVFGSYNRPINTFAPTVLAPPGVTTASFDKNYDPGLKPPELPPLFPGGSNNEPARASASAQGSEPLFGPGNHGARAPKATDTGAAQGSGQQQPQQQPQQQQPHHQPNGQGPNHPNDGEPDDDKNGPPKSPSKGRRKGAGGDGGGGGDGDGGGDGSDSDWSSAHSRDSRAVDEYINKQLRKSHYKEAETVKMPPFPDRGTKVQAWKNCVYQSLNAASGRPDDDVLIWSRQVEDESVTDETLHKVPRRYATLSRKFASALQEKATGELGRKITLTVAKWLSEGKSAPGLLLFRIVVRYYATGRAAEALYNINDLQRIRIHGNDLEQFMNTWEMVLEGMRIRPPDEQLEFIFYRNWSFYP